MKSQNPDAQIHRRDVLLAPFALATTAALSALTTTGCSVSSDSVESQLSMVKNIGNGVYVFPPEQLEETLSKYSTEHNLNIVSLCQGYNGTHAPSPNSIIAVTEIDAERMHVTDMYAEDIKSVEEVAPGILRFPAQRFAEVLAEWRGQNLEKNIIAITANPGNRASFTVLLRRDAVPEFVDHSEQE